MQKLKKAYPMILSLIILLVGTHCKKEESEQEQVEVKILTPKDSSEVSGTLEIVASVYGNYSGGQLNLMIDSSAVATSNDPYITYEWNTDTLPNGSTHTLQAKLVTGNASVLSDEIHVKIVKNKLDLIWNKQIGGAFFSAPAIDNSGNIYLGSDDSYVYAIDPMGNNLWSYKTGSAIYSAISVDDENNLYFGSTDSTFYSLSPDGQLRWKFHTQGSIYSSAAISTRERKVYFGSADSTLYALSVDGNLQWEVKLDGAIFSTPVITSTEQLWVGTDNGTLYKLSGQGNILAKISLNSPIIASLALDANDNVYAGTYSGELYVIDTTGNILWRHSLPGIIHAAPVIGKEGIVYVISTELPGNIKSFIDILKTNPKGKASYIYALNPDGSEYWKMTILSMTLSTPVITNDNILIVGNGDGEILTFSNDGSLVQKIQLSDDVIKSPIALSKEGKLYISTVKGNLLYLFDPHLTPAFEGWPMYGYNNFNNFSKREAWK